MKRYYRSLIFLYCDTILSLSILVELLTLSSLEVVLIWEEFFKAKDSFWPSFLFLSTLSSLIYFLRADGLFDIGGVFFLEGWAEMGGVPLGFSFLELI